MKSVLFLDVDMMLSAGIERHKFGGDERVTLARHLGDRIADATYSWDMRPYMLEGQDFTEVNKGMGESLQRICWMIPESHELAVVALTRTKTSLDDVREMFSSIASYAYRDRFRIDTLVRFEGDVSAAVREHLDSHADEGIEDYAVLTKGKQWVHFRDHYVQYWGFDGSMSHVDELMTLRLLLEHAPWYEWPNYASIERPDGDSDPYGSDRYDKVILLDIDGVLNDEGPAQREGVYVDSRMVDNLAHIVGQTDASIVLTSSWRYAYRRFAEDGFKTEREHLLMLQRELDRCGLRIEGMTPDTSLSGPLARPLEIMEWLRRYWRTNAYVILDDDTFWEWGWLRNNVVTTQTILGTDDYGYPIIERGMTEAHALRAIRTLNGFDGHA